MRGRPTLLLALAILPVLLAGCASNGGDGSANPQLADCRQPLDDHYLDMHVDQAHPEPGKELMITMNLTNLAYHDVPTPGNFTLQIAKADTKAIVLQWVNFTPRFDMPKTVPANSSVFLRRVGDTLPGTVVPGDYVACGVSGTFQDTLPFTVYPRTYSSGSS